MGEHGHERAPSAKALKYAQSIARRIEKPIPSATRASARKLSHWIARQRDARGPRGRG